MLTNHRHQQSVYRFHRHGLHPVPLAIHLRRRLFPKANECELALVYAFVFLLIACRCAGMASVGGRRAPVAQD
jgi:hypothetical protein